VAPFHLLGNLYYVGTLEIAVYLVKTPEGSILLDGGFAETAPLFADVCPCGYVELWPVGERPGESP
jgi:hypothetical protein